MIDPFTILFFFTCPTDRHLAKACGLQVPIHIYQPPLLYFYIQWEYGVLTFVLPVYYIFFYAYSDICFYILMQLASVLQPLAGLLLGNAPAPQGLTARI